MVQYAAAEAKNARKILYYVDAMHPWYKSDKPGIAPDCGMELKPVYAGDAPPAADGEGPPPNTMLVGQDKQQLIGLRYGQAEWITEGQTIRAAGRVAADETQISRVHSKVEGWIEHVSADFTGQLIQKGQPLLTLYSPEMLASQQELLLALKARDVMRHSSLAERPAIANRWWRPRGAGWNCGTSRRTDSPRWSAPESPSRPSPSTRRPPAT